MERQIIMYENVMYLGADYRGNAFTLSQQEDHLVYVEGYVKLKPDDLIKRHHWVFDPERQVAYEAAQFKSLKTLGVRKKISWDMIEYYGYEVTAKEISEVKQPGFVLSDSDLEPIRKKITGA